MKRVEVCEALCALVVRVDARMEGQIATQSYIIMEATDIPCQGTARRAIWPLAVAEVLEAQAHLPTCQGWQEQQEAMDHANPYA